ncbi:unnamed protein product [Arctogadus glacialis]
MSSQNGKKNWGHVGVTETLQVRSSGDELYHRAPTEERCKPCSVSLQPRSPIGPTDPLCDMSSSGAEMGGGIELRLALSLPASRLAVSFRVSDTFIAWAPQ